MGRARYRPIDDCACYWANFCLDKVREAELRKFSEKKKEKKKNIVGIRTRAHSFVGPVQLPLAQ